MAEEGESSAEAQEIQQTTGTVELTQENILELQDIFAKHKLETDKLKEQVKQLRRKDKGKETIKFPKIGEPAKFAGGVEKLPEFENQLEVYFYFREDNFPNDENKVVFASMLLTGSMLQAFTPIKDEYRRDPDNCSAEAKRIMTDYLSFITQLRQNNGQHRLQEKAQKEIINLKQIGSARNYFFKFNQYILITGWDNDALYSGFYTRKGLKVLVKIEVAK